MKACPQCRLKYPSDIQTCFVDGRVLEEMPDPRVGTTIAGRYNIEAVIGEGGMATVYKAHHRLVDRPCAIKVMSRDFADNEVVKERFRREARAAQKLAHPNIIEIFDQGDLEDGSLYLVMELLEGETLAERIAQGKPDLRDALPIGVQIARALARAHDLEVIHRDLKPDNVFLVGAAGGPVTVKLLDFGIARSTRDTRLTGAGEVFGTPQYMAPERIVSIDAGPAADLYALGIILFEMTTGTLPFDARDVPGFFVQHLKVPPPPLRSKDPGLPEALERLVLELLEKDPERRPVDARQVHAELLELARSLDIEVAPEARSGEALPPGPANTLPPVALDAWVRRTKLFEQMLTRAYPGEPPGELAALLSQVRELVDQIALARRTSLAKQRTLEELSARGREIRQRFGYAVDALGIDASKARAEQKAAALVVERLERLAEQRRAEVLDAQREILGWEGRSGMQRPYPELAEAYRNAARKVDEWEAATLDAEAARADLQVKQTTVSDLEFQIQELRNALLAHEDALEKQQSEAHTEIGSLGERADALEARLLEVATAFCAPLRQRPELDALFRELEADVAA